MAGRRDTKRNRRSRSVKARCRALGLSSGVGAVLALGIMQLAAAPTAKADEFDAMLEPIINSITGSLGDLAAGWAAVPELGSLGLGASESVAAASPLDAWFHGLEQDWINSGFVSRLTQRLTVGSTCRSHHRCVRVDL